MFLLINIKGLELELEFKERVVIEGGSDLGIWEVKMDFEGRSSHFDYYVDVGGRFLELPELRDIKDYIFSSIGESDMDLAGYWCHGLYLGKEGEEE